MARNVTSGVFVEPEEAQNLAVQTLKSQITLVAQYPWNKFFD